MIFLIILITLIAIGIVLFLTWFFATKADGNCPICALKAFPPTKITIDTSKDEELVGGSKTPIMGWSSWNALRNHIDEDTIYDMAKAMVDTGLADAGYKYVNIDDCWHSSMRDENGMLQGDLESFPSGIADLGKRINALGLKMGLYTSNGSLTCEDLPASLGHEEIDAKTFASWGAEYFKYDFCHNEKISGKTPIIEYIGISRRGEREFVKLTPDRAKYSGRARAIKVDDLPTKKGIAYLNHGAGKAEFKLDVASSGEYVFTIHFKKLKSRKPTYMQIVVNGEVNEVFFPPSNAFTADARLQTVIKLNSGENIITLQNPVVTRADSSYIQYRRMGKALEDASRDWAIYTGTAQKPITYSLCEWGTCKPWLWNGKVGNMWRTTHDIFAKWFSIYAIYKFTVRLYKYASPGHVNDPDMLEVGNGKLTLEENRSHFSLWCMMAAPLVLGNDLRQIERNGKGQDILDIVTNNELIRIDQDSLVKPAKKIDRLGSTDVLARPLSNGDVALCLFNTSKKNRHIEYDIEKLKDDKYLGISRLGNAQIKDLWTNDIFHSDTIKTDIPAHGVKVYRITCR